MHAPDLLAAVQEELIAIVPPAARELGCEEQLQELEQLLADGGGGIQRAAWTGATPAAVT